MIDLMLQLIFMVAELFDYVKGSIFDMQSNAKSHNLVSKLTFFEFAYINLVAGLMLFLEIQVFKTLQTSSTGTCVRIFLTAVPYIKEIICSPMIFIHSKIGGKYVIELLILSLTIRIFDT